MSLTPIRDSDFSFVPQSWHVDDITSFTLSFPTHDSCLYVCLELRQSWWAPHTKLSHALMKQNIETLLQNYTKFKVITLHNLLK